MSQSPIKLPVLILQDIWQHKWVVLLSFIVLMNAVAVVYTSHISRKLTSQWDQLLQEQDKLDIEWRNLLLEEQSLSEHSRISSTATKELNMLRPLPKDEVIIKQN